MFGQKSQRTLVAALLVLLLTCTATCGCLNIKLPFQSPSPSAQTSMVGSTHILNLYVQELASPSGDQLITGGSVSNVVVTVEPGNGNVLVTTSPRIGYDWSAAAKVAVAVAAKKANVDPNSYNFLFTITNAHEMSTLDGPSAGAAMTIATYSALTKKPTNSSVYQTGTINPDGTIGQIGGVYFKAVAAAKDGAKVLLVPPTQSYGDKDPYQNGIGGVNLQQELKQSGYDVRVVEVHNIDEAMPYYFS